MYPQWKNKTNCGTQKIVRKKSIVRRLFNQAQMFKLSDSNFKMIMVNLLRDPVEKEDIQLDLIFNI